MHQCCLQCWQVLFLPPFLIHLLLFIPLEFFTSVLADAFSQEFKWQQVSWTLLSILAILNNVVIWMVSTRPPTSKSSSWSFSYCSFSYCSKHTNYNWYNCQLHVPQFFQFSSKVEVIIIIIILLSKVYTPVLTGGLSWNLNKSKSPQLSRTPLSTLADFSSAMVWTVSILLLLSCWPKLLFLVLHQWLISVTYMFNDFFSSVAKLMLWSNFCFPLILICWNCNVYGLANSLFFANVDQA